MYPLSEGQIKLFILAIGGLARNQHSHFFSVDKVSYKYFCNINGNWQCKINIKNILYHVKLNEERKFCLPFVFVNSLNYSNVSV